MKKERKVENSSIKEQKKKSDKVKKTSTKRSKVDKSSLTTQKTKAEETIKKRKFTLDIVELLNRKIKNKYYCFLLFLVFILIFFIVLNIIDSLIAGTYSCNSYCGRVIFHPFFMSTFFRWSMILSLVYMSYLMNKHIFTNKTYKFITFIIYKFITFIICLFISFHIQGLLYDISDRIDNMFKSLYKEYKCPKIDYTNLNNNSNLMCVAKPLIYLYPEDEGDVRVKLGYPEKLSHSYPKYESEWGVNAKPNGDLTYNNRPYYGLYWEGKNAPKFELDEGFVIKGSDTITFLEEKLAILGLNEREANEFIIYWLPKLENNPYNFIKFASLDVQNEYMPLEINPKPDTLIRVMMAFKKLDTPIEIKEQVLAPTPIRNGFTVVEWGGTEIDSNKVY